METKDQVYRQEKLFWNFECFKKTFLVSKNYIGLLQIFKRNVGNPSWRALEVSLVVYKT